MNRGEVTIVIMADLSKAFDTVAYEIFLCKLRKLGFSKSSLHQIVSYLTDRTQYVQIGDLWSERINVSFGVPQGFILRPLLFNLYVNDLTDVLPTEVNCHQYTNDITIYSHFKPSELLRVVGRRCRLSTWSFRCNLALHPKKTKVMLLSTPQMSQTHGLDEHFIDLCANGQSLQRVLTFRLLGTEVHQNVNQKRAINCRSQVVTELCLY